MMKRNIDKDLDKILTLFCNKDLELKSPIISTDLVIFKKYNLNFEDKYLILLLKILEDEEYISSKIPYKDHPIVYYITHKGVIKCSTGGFYKETQTGLYTQNLYKYGQFSVIIAGIYYFFEIIKQINNFTSWVKSLICFCI